MSPTYARKGGIKYRYYLSSALLKGAPEEAGSVRRVPAAEVEALAIRSVREHLDLPQRIEDRSLIAAHIARVEVRPDHCLTALQAVSSIRALPTVNFVSRGRKQC